MTALDLTTLPIGTFLRTRDGSRARLDAIDRTEGPPVEITVFHGTRRVGQPVMTNGRQCYHREFGFDVVAIETPKIRVRIFGTPEGNLQICGADSPSISGKSWAGYSLDRTIELEPGRDDDA